jgi:hypothetical protein
LPATSVSTLKNRRRIEYLKDRKFVEKCFKSPAKFLPPFFITPGQLYRMYFLMKVFIYSSSYLFKENIPSSKDVKLSAMPFQPSGCAELDFAFTFISWTSRTSIYSV